jgi:ABC-type branched-subunit amino acid transport system permease subunit
MAAADRTPLALALAAVALLLASLVIPSWLLYLATFALAKGIVVLSLLLLMRAGLVSFGHGLYYALAAYAAGLAARNAGITDAFLLLGLGIVSAAAVAAILGLLLARYREIFFAMLSLAFSMILYGILVKTQALGSTDGFGIPRPTFAGFSPAGEAARQAMFTLTLACAFVAMLLLHRYLGAGLGHLGEAIRENELRLEYLGVSARGVVHLKYVVSGALAGAGGVLSALTSGHIDPEMAYWTTSGEFVFVTLLSGTGHVAAPFIGAFLFELLRTYAFEYAPYTWQMILGAAMLLVILFMPRGLWSLFQARLAVR